jgi:hypothetical protein
MSIFQISASVSSSEPNAITIGRTPARAAFLGSVQVWPTDPLPIAPNPADAFIVGWWDGSVNKWINPTNANNGTKVTQWKDRAFGLQNLNSSGNPEKPTYTTAARVSGSISNSALYYDGVGNYQSSDNPTLLQATTGSMIILVAKFQSTAPGPAQIVCGTGQNDAVLGKDGGNTYFVRYATGEGFAGFGPQDDGNWHLHSVVFDGNGATSPDRLKYRRDRTDVPLSFLTSPGTITSAVNNILFAGSNNSFGSDLFNGYIGELIVYGRAPNGTELQSIENYLWNKWGVMP